MATIWPTVAPTVDDPTVTPSTGRSLPAERRGELGQDRVARAVGMIATRLPELTVPDDAAAGGVGRATQRDRGHLIVQPPHQAQRRTQLQPGEALATVAQVLDGERHVVVVRLGPGHAVEGHVLFY